MSQILLQTGVSTGEIAAPSPDELHLWWLSVKVATIQTTNRLRFLLSDHERGRAAIFRYPADRDRYVVSHVGKRLLLARYLRCHPQSIPIAQDRCRMCGQLHGKPSLPTAPKLYFSMSHAANMVLYGISRHDLGVDVDLHTAVRDYSVLLPHFTPSERHAVLSSAPALRTKAAVQCWVRKEAFFKGTGEGLAGDLPGTYVGIGGEVVFDQPSAHAKWTINDVSAPVGYVAAAAMADVLLPCLVARTLTFDESYRQARR